MPPAAAMVPFFLAALILLLTPGPVVLYIISRSVERGRTAALVSVLGVGTASLVHAAVAVFGISGLLAASPATLRAIQYAGAGWLVWLGIGDLRRPGADAEIVRGRSTSLRSVFAEGFTVNILNPKAPIFYIAFLPQFVDPAQGPVSIQIAWFAGLFGAMAMVTDSAWALTAHAAGKLLARHSGFLRNRHYITGTVLIALGVAAGVAAARG